VRTERDAESFDRALEAFAFGDGVDIHLLAFLERVTHRYLFAQALFRESEFLLDAAADGHLEEFRLLLADGREARLRVDDDRDIIIGLQVELRELLERVFLWDIDSALEILVRLVGEDFRRDMTTIGIFPVEADRDDLERRAFDDRGRAADVLAFCLGIRPVVGDEKMRHPYLVAREAEELGVFGGSPVAYPRMLPSGADPRPKLHASVSWT